MNSVDLISSSNTIDNLNNKGYAIIPNALNKADCEDLIASYERNEFYRKTIDMQRYRFGKGEYKYFNYPLSPLVQQLRESFYPPLAKLANTWMGQLNIDNSFPETHQDFINDCHSKEQTRPTPLILKYETGGFNTLHQDLYGEIFFPFQVIIALTQKGIDNEGGELVLTEQIPRAQSKAMVLSPNQGDAIIITTNFRPVRGTRGFYRANLKHGVSEVKSGTRYSLGIIFHDAA